MNLNLPGKVKASGRSSTGRVRQFWPSCMAAAILTVALIFGGVQPSFAQSSDPNPTTWVTDAAVNAIVTDGTTTYIGGSFLYVGPQTGYGAPVDAATGALGAYPKVNGAILAAISDGAGGWFIGGSFTEVGGLTRNRIAHILSTGAVDGTWNPGANNVVRALVLNGATLYVGGSFTTIGGGASRPRLAALDVTTGLATAWNPNVRSGQVNAMALSGTTLYIGGTFTTIGTTLTTRNRIAAVSTTLNTNNLTSWDPNANNTVSALALGGSILYAGGAFTTVGATPVTRNRIAALDTTIDTNNATAWDPNANNTVSALALSGNTLYAGGAFTTVGATPVTRNRIAALDTAINTNNATAWDPNANGAVNALALSGTTLYVGGAFTSIGGATRCRIAALDTMINTNNATSWHPNANAVVSTIAPSGSAVYVGGSLTSIGGVNRNRIAAIDAATGIPTSWDPDANNTVRSLVLNGTTLYAGGSFTNIGGATRNRIAALYTTTGNAAPWNPNVRNNLVNTMALSGTTLYIGGTFTSVGTTAAITRYGLAALNTSVDSNNVTSWNPGVSGTTINALALGGTTLYVGGNFTTIASQPREYIAAFDTGTGTILGWDPTASDVVTALAVNGSIVYAGGNFGSIGGASPRSFIAALDATTGNATSWNPSASAAVNALAVSGPTVFAGGAFTSIGGSTRNRLAALDTTSGNATAWDPNASAAVLSLAVTSDRVYAGGSFTTMGSPGAPQAYFAEFDAPTLVELAYFRAAVCSDSQICVTWKTRSEIATAGFNILRSETTIDGTYHQVNKRLIPAKGSATTQATYKYVDANLPVPETTCYYLLQEVDNSGTVTTYGPVAVKAP